jgi:hypothetical protein
MRRHSATTMFARFRPSPYRLQVSIVETRRVGGKVRMAGENSNGRAERLSGPFEERRSG